MSSMLPPSIKNLVDEVKNDLESGSAELANKIPSIFIALADDPWINSVDVLKSSVKSLTLELMGCRPTMAPIKNVVISIVKRFVEVSKYTEVLEVLKGLLKDSAHYVLEERNVALEKIKRICREFLQKVDRLATVSYSSTVVSALINAGKKFKIYVGESRPLMEGRKTARMLAEHGMDVVLTTDSALGYFINDVDVAIVGADAILADGSFVNKVGTFQLACIAKFLEKQFIVVADSWKFSDDVNFIGEEHEEYEVISMDDPYYHIVKRAGVSIRNPYFERIPPELVSYYITEYGIHSPSDLSKLIKERMKDFIEIVKMLDS